jgi:hypothetical protein
MISSISESRKVRRPRQAATITCLSVIFHRSGAAPYSAAACLVGWSRNASIESSSAFIQGV